jgi:hypothetical protein
MGSTRTGSELNIEYGGKPMRCVILLLCVSVGLSGCAGREANPVPVYLPGDENRSCVGYQAEIAQLEADMDRILPHTDKGLQNTACVVGGVFLIVPFFFMDLDNADKIEWEALRKRRNRLMIYAAEKGCTIATLLPEQMPSLEELKQQQKSQENQKTKKSPGTSD